MTQVTTVTGLTADRMLEMEAQTVIDGEVEGDNLILKTRDGTEIDAGNVRGPQGITGATGQGFLICTSTTRPATPAEGTGIYETDTDLTRTWTGTRWRVQERIIGLLANRPLDFVAADEGTYFFAQDLNYGFTWTGTRWQIDPRIVCTSATRPAGLIPADEGVIIYETDTDRTYVWSGTAWTQGGAKGEIPGGYFARTTASGSTDDTIIDVGMNIDVMLESGRRYKITVSVMLMGAGLNTNTYAELYIRQGSTQHQNRRQYLGASGQTYSQDCVHVFNSPGAGAATYKVSLARNTGGAGTIQISATAARYSFIQMEDIGPAI